MKESERVALCEDTAEVWRGAEGGVAARRARDSDSDDDGSSMVGLLMVALALVFLIAAWWRMAVVLLIGAALRRYKGSFHNLVSALNTHISVLGTRVHAQDPQLEDEGSSTISYDEKTDEENPSPSVRRQRSHPWQLGGPMHGACISS
jgi:hypothetical protein